MSLAIGQQGGIGKLNSEIELDVYLKRDRTIADVHNRSIDPARIKLDLLTGEAPENSLSTTSNIFGFCGGAHQIAAASTLEFIWEVSIPENARLIRAIVKSTEILQHNIRWFYTAFAPDLINQAYQDYSTYDLVCKRFTKYEGSSFWKGMRGSTIPMSLYALFAGHWPHGDFVCPGGVNTQVTSAQLDKARELIQQFRKEWVEAVLLNGTIADYEGFSTLSMLNKWIAQASSPESGDMPLFLHAAKAFGWNQIGTSTTDFVSFGDIVESTQLAKGYDGRINLTASFPNVQRYNREAHPLFVENIVGEDYTSAIEWPSILNASFEMGGLSRGANLNNGNDGLIRKVLEREGASTWLRGFARLDEIIRLTLQIEVWLNQIDLQKPFKTAVEKSDGIGIGLTEAPKGGLIHLANIENGLIRQYKVFTPNFINTYTNPDKAFPAPLKQALLGTNIKTLDNPIEIGIICRGFDASLRCKINFKKNRSGKEISTAIV